MARCKAGEILFPAVGVAFPQSHSSHCWGAMKPQQVDAKPLWGVKRRQRRTQSTAEPRGSHKLALNDNPAVSLQHDPAKTEAVATWPAPTTVQELQ